MKEKTIILAADHAGFELKESIKKFLENKGYSIQDVGAKSLVPEDDYPVYMSAAAMKVAQDIEGHTQAIIFGGSGQGEAMVANRFPGVRAAVIYNYNPDIIRLSREHNHSNILSVGARFVSDEDAKKSVELWLATSFSNEEKHARRIAQIDSIE